MVYDEQGPVIVGIPHCGLVGMEWAASHRSLSVPDGTIFIYIADKPLDESRSLIATIAMEKNARGVLFWDSDIVPDEQAFQSLLNCEAGDIRSGLYWKRRNPPLTPIAWFEKWHLMTPLVVEPDEIGINGKPVEVDLIGLGFCWIPGYVLDKLVDTGAVSSVDYIDKLKQKHDLYQFFKWEIGPRGGEGEEFDFCRKVRRAGFKIVMDTRVVLRHYVHSVYIGPDGFRHSECL